jgi:uncharacterized protein
MPNRLIHETSPYLLQHANNPVDWYPWGDEAFAKAKQENKPVLVSIGYAACHWCHVMEKESFEDEEVAAFMNSHFVNIKVDREERPDVDHIYMDAVQAMTGSGGWPLNIFLFPDGRPFYGGTYFPPRRAFNRASWTEVLTALTTAFHDRKEELTTQANTLTNHLRSANTIAGNVTGIEFNKENIAFAFSQVMKTADDKWGGFGNAPKFPQTFTISFLLRYGFLSGNKQAENQAILSLDKMIDGGIFDQFGGGFARYSTDAEWLVPHFEKMLYDNALLVYIIAEAYQLTGNKKYSNATSQTIDFIERELIHPDGGFYSALDADSEGEEGKFYVWDYAEVVSILGKDSKIFASYYDITPQGNWEGKSIPWIKTPLPEFAKQQGVAESELEEIISRSINKLMKQRDQRVRPALDDKILLGWNALMNQALSKAFAATGEDRYKEMALRNMDFLLKEFNDRSNGLYHTWKNGIARIPAFLDDYSYLIAALIELAQVTCTYSLLDKAAELTSFVIAEFSDEEQVLFYFTPQFQTDILLRKKELYDGATPSGNAVMARNLHTLSILLDKKEWGERAGRMVSSTGDFASKYPTSFACWLSLLMELVSGTNEVAIIGPGAQKSGSELMKSFLPGTIMMVSEHEDDHFPLLRDKKVNGKTLFFLCRNYACQAPVFSLSTLKSLINANNSMHMQ